MVRGPTPKALRFCAFRVFRGEPPRTLFRDFRVFRGLSPNEARCLVHPQPSRSPRFNFPGERPRIARVKTSSVESVVQDQSSDAFVPFACFVVNHPGPFPRFPRVPWSLTQRGKMPRPPAAFAFSAVQFPGKQPRITRIARINP